MGTAWHEIHTVSVGISRTDRSAPDSARAVVSYGTVVPISRQADSMDRVPNKEYKTLREAPADVPHFFCVVARCPPRTYLRVQVWEYKPDFLSIADEQNSVFRRK